MSPAATLDNATANSTWDCASLKPSAIIAACTKSANYLNGFTTTFTRFRTIVGANTVVVDSQADYLEGTEKSTVASCDIYDFVDAKLVSITSYAVEL